MTNVFEKPHVVAVPFPALGHAIPLLDFVKLLASHGITVTCVTTPASVPRLQHQLGSAILSGLDIRFLVLPTPSVEGLPEGMESFEQVSSDECGFIFELAVKLEGPFNSWLEDQLEGRAAAPPVCIMHDVLLGWSMEVPDKHNIARVVFNTYGAFATSLLHSAWLSASQNALEKQGESVLLSLDLPTPLRLSKHEMDPELFADLMMDILGRFQTIRKSSGMLVNTFEHLEPEYLQHLRNLTGKKVWSIGPVIPPPCFGGTVKSVTRGKTADVSEEQLVRWLDSQSGRSVLYISFGSQTFLSTEQSIALASGLEAATEQPFIWAIKVSPKIESITSDTPILDLARTYLPEGFQERTKNRGLVIWGWVPQLTILSHPSVGAFMSHCGWNSMLESISLGIPLIGWPMYADQHFNSKLAMKLGIGIQACEHRDGIPDMKRMKDAVTLVLSTEEGKGMKRDAEKLKEMARKAVAFGGSSNTNLLDFVSEVLRSGIDRNGGTFRGSFESELEDNFLREVPKPSISNST